jgi:hypothetical protein
LGVMEIAIEGDETLTYVGNRLELDVCYVVLMPHCSSRTYTNNRAVPEAVPSEEQNRTPCIVSTTK